MTLVAAGCTSSNLQLVSYKDPYFPETYRVNLTSGAYRTDPGGDIHAAAEGSTAAEHGATREFLHVHVFWKPMPGKTPADSTTTDATIRYVVETESGVAVYSGTGFAFPKETFGGGLDLVIEASRLRLESQSGALGDLFGNSRLTGTLKTRHDPVAAANIIRAADRAAAR